MPNKKLRFLFVVGTRPEVIKEACVVYEAQKNNVNAEILHTGQHKELANEMFEHFNLEPTYNLEVMQPNQSLFELTANIIGKMGEIIEKKHYDMIFVQGDTTTAFLGALAGFYLKIPVGHIEAGLRTNNRYSPFPEEINRRLASRLASLHFAPTERAKKALLNENINESSVFVVGNTVVDALLYSKDKEAKLTNSLKEIFAQPERLILITTHRRENFGETHRQIFSALLELVNTHQDVRVLFPVHPNPRVLKEAEAILNNHPRICLTSPLNYQSFIAAMKRSYFIMSDSGGVQEEAPSLNKPVLILRESTERPEGVETGALKLVGTDKSNIIAAANELLTNQASYNKMANAKNPYGDGLASQRIIKTAIAYCQNNKRPN